MSNYAIDNNLYHKDYVVNYTNASFLVKPGFAFADGLFSGFDKDKKAYDYATWDYDTDAQGSPQTDPTLQNPRCVFQLLKAEFNRYTPEMAAATTGVPRDKILEMAQTFCATGQPGKAGTSCMPWAPPSIPPGSRSSAVTVSCSSCWAIWASPAAASTHCGGKTTSGSTDMGLLFNTVTAYMAIPSAAAHPTLKDYLDKETPKATVSGSTNRNFSSAC